MFHVLVKTESPVIPHNCLVYLVAPRGMILMRNGRGNETTRSLVHDTTVYQVVHSCPCENVLYLKYPAPNMAIPKIKMAVVLIVKPWVG